MSVVRIAMWSGPRNISTAMMRSWGNRSDTWVWDEPFYAHYLVHTGLDHPMKNQVIEHGEIDHRRVIERLMGSVPDNKPVYFQKHMTHHLLGHIDRSWMADVVNCFLIRHPREVVASYAMKREQLTLMDIGIVQQAELFEHVIKTTGAVPPILDAADVLRNPESVLSALCSRIGVEFTNRMLSWPAGRRECDGVWGKHWYNSVETSTGFSDKEKKYTDLPIELDDIAQQALPFYQRMYRCRITVPTR